MNIHDDLYKKLSREKPLLYELWEPRNVAVVLGRSQKAVDEVNLVNCVRDKVPVLKRRGGGGAVVLMPGVLCLTIAFYSKASISPYFFFEKINHFIIDVLENHFSIQDLHYKGISDIAIGDKKVLGCSMFNSRDMFFYQGSLLVHPDMEKISTYLLHPSKEPDYRCNRPHRDFITSLRQSGYPVTIEQVKTALQVEIERDFIRVIS